MKDISKLIETGYAKPIENLEYTKGFKGYWVLKNGKIWSKPRMGSKGGFIKAHKCGPTKKDPTKKEYLFVRIRDSSSKSHSKKVHIIVAEAFVGPRPIGANGKPLDTDHIDHDQFNNHCKNLQYLTRRENIQRSRLNKKNKSSSYLGVYPRANNKFQSKIWNKKTIFIGTFNEEIEAAKAYDLKAYEFFGEETILNFPEFKEEYKKIIKLQKENPQQRELDFNGQENEK